jgi:two-component system CheB/CheR fusion protein
MSKKTTARVKPVAAINPLLARSADFLPIVGIGASAGGLEAFEAFFRACPVATGMAFVLVPHLDPSHVSLLTEILQRATAMPVHEALDQMAVEANHVYIIPPNREMAILGGVLQLSVPEQVRGQRMPIDGFLRSLADDQGEHAIGIVLSGTATDGTLGLRAILGAGGVCMVQEPSSAKYDGMPLSAINAGYATHILPVEQMPAMLLKVTRLSGLRLNVPAVVPEKSLSGISQILLQVRSTTGHDFSLYKKSTIGRRIERRMAQHGIEEHTIYARYLRAHPAEVQLLFKELLINVTSFFRDPEAFVALKLTILPALLAGKPPGYTFRVWVAGCASGEEAYSIAIVLHELLDEVNENAPDRFAHDIAVQIYATDLDEDAIATARAGCFPPNIAQDVTPERLRRFFTKDDSGYKVKKNLRESIVFAVQNVVKDPPFTKLDLLSCRNLMIYLEPELQSRLIPNFHYALKPDGVLFLSTSESITNQTELFAPLDRKWKFYRAIHGHAASARSQTMTGHLAAPLVSTQSAAIAASTESAMIAPKKFDSIADLSNRALLQSYAPAAVTIDARGDILYVHGDTGRYLRPAPGPLSSNVVDMAREGLQQPLRAALLGAAAVAEPQRSGEVSVKTNGGFSLVRFSLSRLPGQHGNTKVGVPLLLVCFEDIPDAANADVAPAPPAKKRSAKASARSNEHDRIAFLENELAYNKENLQATIEEAQAANEELKSTNEELQSTNEELQSSNEELETSKEELQSLNEETITVNSELNARIEQLSSLQNDMKNLFDNINIGTLFIDHDLVIRRYTREAVKIYRLIAGDVGRSLGDIKSNIAGDDLLAEIQSVLDSLIPVERELQTLDGTWYQARIQPYRTLDNVIEGVVLTFHDISERREAERLNLGVVQLARELAEGIVNTLSEPLIVLDGQLQVVSASRSFYAHFQVKAEETVGRKIYDLGNGQWRIPALRKLLEGILPHDQVIEGYVVEHDFPGLGQRRMQLNARRIVTAIGNTELILLAMVAIEQKEAHEPA